MLTNRRTIAISKPFAISKLDFGHSTILLWPFDLATLRPQLQLMSEQRSEEVQVVDAEFDSTLESVDSAEDAVLHAAGKFGFDEEDLHKIGIAVRESMVNAVVHGNRYNIRKKVHLKVKRGEDRIIVEIRDEGEGFELEKIPDPLAEENLLRHSGRGILLMQSFMDEFEMYRADPKGTEVRLVKYRGKD